MSMNNSCKATNRKLNAILVIILVIGLYALLFNMLSLNRTEVDNLNYITNNYLSDLNEDNEVSTNTNAFNVNLDNENNTQKGNVQNDLAGMPLPWWDGGPCSSVAVVNVSVPISGHCGNRAHLLGKGQLVLSYTLYGNFSIYATGLSEILETASSLYPGWIVRLYTRPESYREELCPLLERFNNFHVCHVDGVIGTESNTLGSGIHPMKWRMAPLGDPLVEAYFSRDLDAQILQREVDAVKEFLESNKTLHLMRDHPYHSLSVMGGMYGVRNKQSELPILRQIRSKVFRRKAQRLEDQIILQWVMFPKLAHSTLQHDSYNCRKFPSSLPFPTQRQGRNFVGNTKYRGDLSLVNVDVSQKCPTACRPRLHQDWEFC